VHEEVLMFGKGRSIRIGRSAAAGALMLAVSASAMGGTAVATPQAEDERGCSVLAHERNAGAKRLHEAWKGYRDQLQTMSRDFRQVEKGAGRSNKDEATTLAVDARGELSAARDELDAIRSKAHADIQDLVELGQACKQPRQIDDENPHMTLAAATANEDGTVTVLVQFNEAVECAGTCKTLFTYTANAEADAVNAETWELSEDGMTAELTFKLAEDEKVEGSSDKLTFTAAAAASLKDGDTNTMANENEALVELSLTTNDLVKKYREVVDQALKDMQAVMDEVTTLVSELLAAAESDEATAKAKAKDRERGKSEKAGGRGRGPRR
jgi:ElaB/YqjD/DUF883 family membrane-anchored ribosome-binding protein